MRDPFYDGLKYLATPLSICAVIAIVALLAFGIFLFPAAASASGGNAVNQTFCNIIGLFSGGTGYALKVVCIIIFGILLLRGRISLEKSLLEVLGTALVIGAGSVVVALGGPTAGCT